jgi:hypothetical protein
VTGFARKKWGEVDTEDVPIEYAAQFMHGLMVTGRRMCLVAALRSFDDVDLYWTLRDDETIAGMREKLVDFWLDHVQPTCRRTRSSSRHQGALPARQRPGRRGDAGHRRQGRAAARDQGRIKDFEEPRGAHLRDRRAHQPAHAPDLRRPGPDDLEGAERPRIDQKRAARKRTPTSPPSSPARRSCACFASSTQKGS